MAVKGPLIRVYRKKAKTHLAELIHTLLVKTNKLPVLNIHICSFELVSFTLFTLPWILCLILYECLFYHYIKCIHFCAKDVVLYICIYRESIVPLEEHWKHLALMITAFQMLQISIDWIEIAYCRIMIHCFSESLIHFDIYVITFLHKTNMGVNLNVIYSYYFKGLILSICICSS